MSFQTMVELRSGDLFTAPVEVLVNPTNARGVSGKGLALEFKRRFPILAKDYQAWCEAQKFETNNWPIGQCFYWDVYPSHQPPKAIVCLPTKDDWRQPSRLSWIEDGLRSLVELLKAADHQSVAMPALGCGLGGLSLGEVKPLIDRVFFGTRMRAIVFANKGEVALPGRQTITRLKEDPNFRGPVRPVLAGGARG